MTATAGTTRLARYHALLDALTPHEEDTFKAYLLASLSAAASGEDWDAGLWLASELVAKDRARREAS